MSQGRAVVTGSIRGRGLVVTSAAHALVPEATIVGVRLSMTSTSVRRVPHISMRKNVPQCLTVVVTREKE